MNSPPPEISENLLRSLAQSATGVTVPEDDWGAIVAIVQSLAKESAAMRAYDVKDAEPAVVYTVSPP